MPLSIVKGHYRIQGSESDGGSVHFHPSDPRPSPVCSSAPISTARRHPAAAGAIDALEAHYSPQVRGGFLQHQPLALAHAAAATLVQQ